MRRGRLLLLVPLLLALLHMQYSLNVKFLHLFWEANGLQT